MLGIFLSMEKMDGQENKEQGKKNIEDKEFSPCSVHPFLNSMTILQKKSSPRKG